MKLNSEYSFVGKIKTSMPQLIVSAFGSKKFILERYGRYDNYCRHKRETDRFFLW